MLINKINELSPLPDIVIIDVSMPLMNGFNTISFIAKNHHSINCIGLSQDINSNSVFKIIEAGAKGFLGKDSSPEHLEEIILQVYNTGSAYNAFVMERIMEYNKVTAEKDEKFNSDIAILTKREMEFLIISLSDLTYKEIAEKMKVSPRTVDAYRDSIFHKLNIKSRSGLMLYAAKLGLFNDIKV